MRLIGWTSGNAIIDGTFSRINYDYITTLAYTAVQPVSAADPTIEVHYGDFSHLTAVVAAAHGAGKSACISLYDDIALGGCFNAFVDTPALLAEFAANVATLVTTYDFDEVMVDHEDWTEAGPAYPKRLAFLTAIYNAVHPLGVEVGYYSSGLTIPDTFEPYADWMEVAYNPSGWPPVNEFDDFVAATEDHVTAGWPKAKLVAVIEVWADATVGGWGSPACTYNDLFVAGLDLYASSASRATIDSAFWGAGWTVPGGALYWHGINLIHQKIAWMLANGYENLTYFTSDYDTVPNDSPYSLIRNAFESLGGTVTPTDEGIPITAVFDGQDHRMSLEWDDREIYNDVRSEIEITESTEVTGPGTDPTYGYGQTRNPMGHIAIGATRDQDTSTLTGLSGLQFLDGWVEWQMGLSRFAATFLGMTTLLDKYTHATYRVVNNTGEVIVATLVANYMYTVAPAHDGTTHTDTNQRTLTVRATDATSIAKYGRRTMNLIWPMGQTQTQMQSLVDSYIARYSEPVARVTVTLRGSTDFLIAQILSRKVSDKVTLSCTALGLYANFWIDSVEISHNVFGVLEATWVCEETRGSEQVGLFIIDTSEIDGPAVLAY